MDRLRRVWIYRRRGDRGWYVYWREQGRTRCRRAPTKEVAQRLRDLKWAELNAWAVPAINTPWERIVELYDGATSHLADGTLRLLNTIIRRIHAEFSPATAAELTPELFDRYFTMRRASVPQPSDATLAKEWRHLHAFGTWLVQRGYSATNPLDSVAQPRATHRKKRVPSQREWLALLEAIPRVQLDDPQGWHLLIVLAVTVGLRQGDLLGITVRDIELGDADTEHVGLLRAHVRKARKEQWLGLPRAVNDRVAARIAALPDGSDRLFLWRQFPRRAWQRIAAGAGYTHEFSRLRAAAGGAAAFARLQAAGAEHLGHSSPRVFARHYSDDAALARLVAQHQSLPELPPMPPLVLRAMRRSRTANTGRLGRFARGVERGRPGGPPPAGAG